MAREGTRLCVDADGLVVEAIWPDGTVLRSGPESGYAWLEASDLELQEPHDGPWDPYDPPGGLSWDYLSVGSPTIH